MYNPQLEGESLMLMHRNWSHYVDELRDDLTENHPDINIVDFDFYDVEVFNRCGNSNEVLLAIKSWESIHPLIKIIPVDLSRQGIGIWFTEPTRMGLKMPKEQEFVFTNFIR